MPDYIEPPPGFDPQPHAEKAITRLSVGFPAGGPGSRGGGLAQPAGGPICATMAHPLRMRLPGQFLLGFGAETQCPISKGKS